MGEDSRGSEKSKKFVSKKVVTKKIITNFAAESWMFQLRML